MSTIVAINGDLHVNSLVGLCPPVFRRERGSAHLQSPAQKASWECWVKDWAHVRTMKEQTGAKVYAVFPGDMVDVNVRNKAGLITHKESDILQAAVDVLAPAREVADKLFIVRGTAAHTGLQGWMEDQIGTLIGAEEDSETYSRAWWNLPLLVEGVLFDVGHHPHTYGMRPWTKQSALARESAIILHEAATKGFRIPDVVVRAHVHYYGDSGDGTRPRVFFAPPWQWTTSFGFRLGVGADVEPVGGLLFFCDNGTYNFYARRHFAAEREPWTDTK